ncbi:MAG: 50S ribosomal protein L17 [Gemmatimonadetes bacterium]|nr:50S ribosomal protein L17 [Gemmatimonadota bacterium]
MRHKKRTIKLNRTASHRRAMFRNLTTAMFNHGEVRTTLAKAKYGRRYVERMITLGKRGDLHARRQAARFIQEPKALQRLFDEIAPGYKEVNGGYTRVIRLGYRQGDDAPMAILQLTHKPESMELVDE